MKVRKKCFFNFLQLLNIHEYSFQNVAWLPRGRINFILRFSGVQLIPFGFLGRVSLLPALPQGIRDGIIK
jgi:hypothetical protein